MGEAEMGAGRKRRSKKYPCGKLHDSMELFIPVWWIVVRVLSAFSWVALGQPCCLSELIVSSDKNGVSLLQENIYMRKHVKQKAIWQDCTLPDNSLILLIAHFALIIVSLNLGSWMKSFVFQIWATLRSLVKFWAFMCKSISSVSQFLLNSQRGPWL